MNRQNLIHVYDLCLGYGQKLVEDVSEDQMTQQMGTGLNHPAWVLGHLAFVAHRGAQLLTGRLVAPEGFAEKFGRGTTPMADRAAYPDKADLLQAYLDGHATFVDAMLAAGDEQLAAPNTRIQPDLLPTLGDVVTHMMSTHEATHLGQLSAWRRVAGLPAVS